MIRLSNVFKTYDRGETAVHALQGVSLEIAEGEFVAVMGPSGSGKSTLLHILGLLDVLDDGNYNLFGHDIHHLSDDALTGIRNTSIGFVFQHFNLLPRTTALENVLLPVLYAHHKPNPEAGRQALSAIGLADRITHRPNELSGGQQQRVAIARALINNPRLILADEPTGNLDSKSAGEIMEIIAGLNRAGLTVVMVTHEEDIARYAGRIIHMRDGMIQRDEPNAARRKMETRNPQISGRPSPPPSRNPPTASSGQNGWKSLAAGTAANLKQAWRALRANKVRAALSMLGILIGVAAVIAMLAIGQGARKSIEDQLASMGSNLLTMRSGPPRTGGVRMSEGMITRFTRENIADIKREIHTVSNAAGVVYGRGQATYGGKNWNTRVMGVEPVYAPMHASRPIVGRFFNENEMLAKARVAAIGMTLVRELFDGANPLGEYVKINKVNFQVVGVLPEKGSTHWWDQDDLIMIPLTTAMDRLLGTKYLHLIEIEVASQADMEKTQEQIRELIIRTHRLPPSRHESFDIRNMAEIQDALTETSRVLSWLLSGIAAVSMLVGGIGIMNIMLVSVTERTREIGIRKAVGAKRRDIMIQFLTEALVISIFGGLMGITCGWLISLGVSYFADWASIVTAFSITLAVSFSAAIGVVFGLWPARKAAVLSPIDALRYE
ncbi:MAG: ABC transporter permease [Kiritimatiellae bacterium]|nr:ABC transporter permease [Kiritimatiellia bacterium]